MSFMSLRGKRLQDGSIDWNDALKGALVMFGYSFISSLIAVGVVTLMKDPGIVLLSAALSGALGFFGVLIAKLGLKPNKG